MTRYSLFALLLAAPLAGATEPELSPTAAPETVEPELAPPPETSREFAKLLRKDWDLLGIDLNAQAGHTLFYVGPHYQLVSKTGLYVDASAGLGITLRDGGPLFGEGHAFAGWVLASGLKNKDTLFNLYQESSTSGTWTETTYVYMDTQVVAQRNLVVFGGARAMVGHGPDLGEDKVAPGYLALTGGISNLTTWRERQKVGDIERMIRGAQGWELRVYYAPQSSPSTNFSNFEHWGGEFRVHRTAEIGKGAWPFHLGLGMEPGLGPMIRMGTSIPVASPLAGPLGKTGEFR